MTLSPTVYVSSMSVAYCIEYLNEEKGPVTGQKKGLSLRWGERKRSRVVTLVSI